MTKRTKQNDENNFWHDNDFWQRARRFTFIKRPKGFYLGRRGKCYGNAAWAAMEGRAQYVEGYAGVEGRGGVVHHAWLTVDGRNAIDVTFREPGAFYFGVVFDTKDVAKAALDREVFDAMLPQLPPLLLWSGELEEIQGEQ